MIFFKKYGDWLVIVTGLIALYYFEKDKSNDQSAAIRVAIIVVMGASGLLFSKIYPQLKMKVKEQHYKEHEKRVKPQMQLYVILVAVTVSIFGISLGLMLVCLLPAAIVALDITNRLFSRFKDQNDK